MKIGSILSGEVIHDRQKLRALCSDAVLWIVFLGCIGLILILCRDMGLDYDESYGYRTAHDYTIWGIMGKVLADHDTDVPLYYQMMRVWALILGNDFWAYKTYSLAGTVASMLLGLTAVRRFWGRRTALLYIVSVSLMPTLLHVSYNIRMYSWTIFAVTASMLLAYSIMQGNAKRWKWICLCVLTVCALLYHYFTALYFLIIYGWLFLELWLHERRQAWKVFPCGIVGILPTAVWMLIGDAGHFAGTGEETTEVAGLGDACYRMMEYLFSSNLTYGSLVGAVVLLAVFVAAILMFRGNRIGEKAFVLIGLTAYPLTYLVGLAVASHLSHFFLPRHVIHGGGLLWLTVAIVLPRINWRAYLSGAVFILGASMASFAKEYRDAFTNVPYLEATMAFAETEMEPGDVVVYTTDHKFGSVLYGCYMPEQEFVDIREIEDWGALADENVWLFLNDYQMKPDEKTMETYGISMIYVGHYGFQIIGNCTDFDVYKVTIGAAEE